MPFRKLRMRNRAARDSETLMEIGAILKRHSPDQRMSGSWARRPPNRDLHAVGYASRKGRLREASIATPGWTPAENHGFQNIFRHIRCWYRNSRLWSHLFLSRWLKMSVQEIQCVYAACAQHSRVKFSQRAFKLWLRVLLSDEHSLSWTWIADHRIS